MKRPWALRAGTATPNKGDTVHNLLTDCDLCVKYTQWTCKDYLESAHRDSPMPRTPRKQQWTEEACYHVMNRGHNRERIFGDDDDRRHFLGLLARYRERFGLRLYHYCLMTNHFHVLVQLERPADLSRWLSGMLRAYVHYFNRRYRFVGHLWQGRFKSPAIQCEGYLLSCGRYIERNPLEAGLVTEPWQYAWSSCRAYASGAADPLLAENSYYLEWGVDDGSRQRRWREFLIQEDPKEQPIRRGLGGG